MGIFHKKKFCKIVFPRNLAKKVYTYTPQMEYMVTMCQDTYTICICTACHNFVAKKSLDSY
jgi:hypothetical protein